MIVNTGLEESAVWNNYYKEKQGWGLLETNGRLWQLMGPVDGGGCPNTS